MNTTSKIAWRYIRGKKSAQAINIISWISMAAIMFSTAAMIVLFSVYNGIEGLTKDLFTAFYPDVKVQPVQGKYFEAGKEWAVRFDNAATVEQWSYTIEDMALFSGERQQKIGKILGVSNSWFEINNLQKYILDGQAYFNEKSNTPQAVVGARIANTLGLESDNIFSNFAVYYPKVGANFSTDYANAYSSINIQPTGIFRVATEFDDKYVIVPIRKAQELMEQQHQFSGIDFKLKKGATFKAAKAEIKQIIAGVDNFSILDRYEQNKTLYMVLNSEKWAVYAILLMVMLVASFNMIGSLSMLVLEKKKDIAILKSMGASASDVKLIFLKSGLFQSVLGGFVGLIIGYLICLMQKTLGLVSMGSGFIVNAYPVSFKLSDFVLVIISVVAIGFIASYFPARKASKNPLVIKEE